MIPDVAVPKDGSDSAGPAGRVLVVDDEKGIRNTLRTILKRNGYEAEAAAESEEALGLLSSGGFDVVVSDLILPGKSGIELAEAIRERAPDVMIILMTGEPTVETATQGLRLGVLDYLAKPVPTATLLRCVAQAVNVKRIKDEAARLREAELRHAEVLEQKVAARTLELTYSLERLSRVMKGTIQTLAQVIEARDPYTAGHQQSVAELARAISAARGESVDFQDGIYLGGLIHDMGKIAVPAEILSKPGRLTEIEFRLVKVHPQTAFDILSHIEFPWPIAEMVYQHHERLDGSGYPRGLKGESVVKEARILAVADVVEAVASHRPYRPALGVKAALQEVLKHRGTQFDGDVVDVCFELFETGAFRFSPTSTLKLF